MKIAVTGTNTDVGKTIVTAALAVELNRRNVAGGQWHMIKPVQTGVNDSDARTVRQLTGIETEEVMHYPEALAPDQSALRAGIEPATLEEVAAEVDKRDGNYLVEGAGGILVRLGQDWTFLDLCLTLNLPIIVVTSMQLGSLNAAELTVSHIRSRGATVLGVIGGSYPADPDLPTRLNVDEMEVKTGVPFAGVMPEGSGTLGKTEFARVAAELELNKLGL